jgi:hypothetical protein
VKKQALIQFLSLSITKLMVNKTSKLNLIPSLIFGERCIMKYKQNKTKQNKTTTKQIKKASKSSAK